MIDGRRETQQQIPQRMAMRHQNRHHASEEAQTTEVSQLDPEPCSQRAIQNFRLLISP